MSMHFNKALVVFISVKVEVGGEVLATIDWQKQALPGLANIFCGKCMTTIYANPDYCL